MAREINGQLMGFSHLAGFEFSEHFRFDQLPHSQREDLKGMLVTDSDNRYFQCNDYFPALASAGGIARVGLLLPAGFMRLVGVQADNPDAKILYLPRASLDGVEYIPSIVRSMEKRIETLSTGIMHSWRMAN